MIFGLNFINEFLKGDERDSSMAKDLECPVCDADIPLEGNEKPGDLVLCSYCKVTFKLIKSKGKWALTEEFEE